MTRKPYTRPTLHRRLLTPALAAMGALLLAACAADDAPDAPTGPARRTVVVYAAAQNTLGRDGYLRADSAEMVEGARSLKSDEQLLLFADDATGARIYRFRRDGGAPERVWSRAGETCSTDPATLAEVLAWCATAYPADEYGLVMWSHASGWVPSTNPPTGTTLSFGIDTGEGGRGDMTADGRLGVQMDIDDIARAIEAAGVKLRYVLFDACLMGGVETAYALRNVADYVVGAPISTPAAGADYAHQVREGLFSNDPADIARTYYADVTDPANAADYADFGIAVAAVRTAALDELAAVTADVLPRSALAGRADADMEGVQQYANYASAFGYRPHAYDASEAMRRLLTAADFARYKAALSAAIAWQGVTERFYVGPTWRDYLTADPSLACGVSMFVPRQIYTDNAASCAHGDLNEAFRRTAWYSDAGWEATGW